MEIIKSISDAGFEHTDGNYEASYDGYIIETTEQTIKIGVSNSSSCCEQWGYLTTNDDINEFVGAEILSISRVDELLNTKNVGDTLEYLDEGGTMFVNIDTTKGTLQLVVYNSHNGYYGHSAVLISKQLTEETTL